MSQKNIFNTASPPPFALSLSKDTISLHPAQAILNGLCMIRFLVF